MADTIELDETAVGERSVDIARALAEESRTLGPAHDERGRIDGERGDVVYGNGPFKNEEGARP